MFLMILWSIVFIRMITVSPWGGWMYRIKLMMTLWMGHDTDTTACVLGGLSGILYGIQGIPGRWISMLRERDKVEGLLGSLFNRAGE